MGHYIFRTREIPSNFIQDNIKESKCNCLCYKVGQPQAFFTNKDQLKQKAQ